MTSEQTLANMEELLKIETANRMLLEAKLQDLTIKWDRKEAVTRCERPPKFYGKDNERADTWLFLNKQYFVTIGMEQAASLQQMILLAASGFRENAAIWWEHVIREMELERRPKMQTWADFEKAVKDEFQPLDSEQVARDRLADLIQTTSVTAYVNALRDLALQISDLSSGDLLHKFKRGLKPNIRREVELRDPKTLDEAVKMAERADVIEMGQRNLRRPAQGAFFNGAQRTGQFRSNGPPRSNFNHFQGPRPPQNRHYGPQPMELGAMQGARTERRGSQWNEHKARDNSQVECWNCHRKGHTARQCRSPAAANTSKGGRQ